jgi:hypothetical protein
MALRCQIAASPVILQLEDGTKAYIPRDGNDLSFSFNPSLGRRETAIGEEMLSSLLIRERLRESASILFADG